MKLRTLLLVLLSGSAMCVTVRADNTETATGKQLHDQYCVKCHDTSIYTRPDRIIKNFQELQNRVRQCEISNQLTWFDEEINAVVLYLNDNFYHFPKH